MLLRMTCSMAALGVAMASLAGAAQKGSSKGGDNTQTVMDLRQVVKTLGEAKHDYDGHRSKAVEEIHKAIKALEGKSDTGDKGKGDKGKGDKGKGEKGKGDKGSTADKGKGDKGSTATPALSKEEQAASDKLLTQARDKLKSLEPKVVGMSGAAADLAAAIKELDAALKVK